MMSVMSHQARTVTLTAGRRRGILETHLRQRWAALCVRSIIIVFALLSFPGGPGGCMLLRHVHAV